MKRLKFQTLTLALNIPLHSLKNWFEALNLKDAYFHINIRQSHSKLLCFCSGYDRYQHKVLPPSGSSQHPKFYQTFSYLRLQSIYFSTLYDWLVQAASYKNLKDSVQKNSSLVPDLRWSVNPLAENLFHQESSGLHTGQKLPPGRRIIKHISNHWYSKREFLSDGEILLHQAHAKSCS